MSHPPELQVNMLFIINFSIREFQSRRAGMEIFFVISTAHVENGSNNVIALFESLKQPA